MVKVKDAICKRLSGLAGSVPFLGCLLPFLSSDRLLRPLQTKKYIMASHIITRSQPTHRGNEPAKEREETGSFDTKRGRIFTLGRKRVGARTRGTRESGNALWKYCLIQEKIDQDKGRTRERMQGTDDDHTTTKPSI